MKKVLNWLQVQAPLFSVLYIVPLYFICSLFYDLLIIRIISMLQLPGYTEISSGVTNRDVLRMITPLQLFAAVMLEEIIFRFIPLLLVQWGLHWLNIRIKQRGIVILSTVLIFSIIFGYLHGNYLNIFIQGVDGIVLSLLFLKYGGYLYVKKKNDLLDPFAAIIICASCHWVFNFIIIQMIKMTH